MTAPLFFLLLFTPLELSQPQEELIALIRQGNQNSRAFIRSIHARYEITPTNLIPDESGKIREPTISKVEWWQDGERVRWTQEITQQLTEDEIAARMRGAARDKRAVLVMKRDCASVDGEVRIINSTYWPDGSHSADADIRTYNPDDIPSSDIWRTALFIVLEKPRSGLYDLLSNPSCVRKLEKVGVGETSYHLVIQAPKPMEAYELELTVEPSKNYLVSSLKANTASPKETVRFDEKILAFREIARGLFFPVEYENRSYAVKRDGPDVLFQIARLKYTLLEINQDSTNYPFHLPIPAGMGVVDHRNGTSYIATKDGKPKVVGPAPKEVPAAKVPTYDEPEQSPLLFPIAAACVVAALLLAGGIYYSRRKRAQAIHG